MRRVEIFTSIQVLLERIDFYFFVSKVSFVFIRYSLSSYQAYIIINSNAFAVEIKFSGTFLVASFIYDYLGIG